MNHYTWKNRSLRFIYLLLMVSIASFVCDFIYWAYIGDMYIVSGSHQESIGYRTSSLYDINNRIISSAVWTLYTIPTIALYYFAICTREKYKSQNYTQHIFISLLSHAMFSVLVLSVFSLKGYSANFLWGLVPALIKIAFISSIGVSFNIWYTRLSKL